ncbi:MAG: succinylglutamate desuccinylase/aspartoacylase family protein [Deltaproteobacteria bacterium]|nr:succinylglutamate desuccinylase/aspartoacylase family protein [Deltaproteobacteria bacterium]
MIRPAPILCVLLLVACRSEPDVLARAWVRIRRPADAVLLHRASVSFAEARDGDRVAVIAPEAVLERLADRGLEVEVTHPDHRLSVADRSAHPHPDALLEALEDLADQVPDRVEYVDLGDSVAGRDLAAVRLGQGPWTVRVTGAHHGDEPVSGTLALAVAEALAWGAPPEAQVWILPHVNPDGVVAGTRYNRSGVDLNRNYDYAWSDAEFRSGDRPFSEPEVRAVRALAAWRPPTSGLALHAGARNLTWPWNHTTQDSPDEDLMSDLADAYAGRCTAEGFETMNGAEWYITHGDSNDWSYGRRATLDFTVEVSREGAPDASGTARVVEAHLDAILDFLARPPQVVGTVLDAEDGQPLEATITPAGGQPSVSAPDGGFARFLPEGEHVLAFSAPGWEPAFRTVEASEGVTQTVEVRLERAALLDGSSVLLPWSEDPVRLDWDAVGDEEITLFRPGEASVRVLRDVDAFPVQASLLSPGPWGLETSAGAAPRVVFVGEVDDRVEIEQVSWQGSTLELSGHGFGRGSRAWALAGPGRLPVPLRIRSESERTVVLDGAAALALPDPVDLFLVSDGAQLAVLDVCGTPQVDTGEPHDTGFGPDTGGPADTGVVSGHGTCGCLGSSGGGRVAMILAVGIVLARRPREVRRAAPYSRPWRRRTSLRAWAKATS